MPGSTPRNATPRNAAIARANSDLRWRHSLRVPGMSASESDATMTTAARVGCGSHCMRPGTKTSITRITAAPTSPVSCVFAPARSATAVRDPLVLTGKPVNRPAAMLAVPIADHLLVRVAPPAPCGRRTPTTWRSCRPARRRRSRTRPPNSSGRSASSTRGMVNGGRPLGSTPTRLDPLAAEVEDDCQHHGGDHRDQHGRHLRAGRGPRIDHHDDAEQPDGERRGHRLAGGDALHERLGLVDRGRRHRSRSRTASAAGR